MVQLVESFWSGRLFDEEMNTWRCWCRELLVNGEIRVAKEGGPCDGKMIRYLYTNWSIPDRKMKLWRWICGGLLDGEFLDAAAFFSERDVVHKQGARQWFAEPCPPSTQPGIWYFQSVKDFVTGLERTWCQTVKYFIFYVKDYVSCNERWMMISRIFCGTKGQ